MSTGYALQFTAADNSYVGLSGFYGGAATSLTVVMWAKLLTDMEHGGFWYHGSVGSARSGYGFGVGATSFDDDGNTLIGYIPGGPWIPTGAAITSGVWHMILMEIDASGYPSFELDNVLVETYAAHAVTSPSGNLQIGGFVDEGSYRFPNVQIDAVQYYLRLLTSDEKAHIWNNGVFSQKAANPANLILNLDEGTGTTAADSSGNGLDGTLYGDTLPAWVEHDIPILLNVAISNSLVHPGGSSVLTFSYFDGSPADSEVTITLTSTVGTLTPSTLTATTSGSWTGTVTLSVTSDTSQQGGTVTATSTLPTVTQGFTVQDSLIKIASAAISPTANLLLVFIEKVQDSTRQAVKSIGGGGGTISVNGGSPIAITGDWFFDGVNNYACAPLKNSFIAIVDDADAVTMGSWTPVSGYTDGALWYGDAIQYSDDPDAMITYTFPALPPGQYHLDAIIDNQTSSGGLTGPTTRTAGARYVIKDGGTTVGTFDIDQNTLGFYNLASNQAYRWLDLQYHWTGINTDPTQIVIADGSAVTVTISNYAATGQLFADAVRLELVTPPIAAAGDTVTFTPSDGLFVTAIDSTGLAADMAAPVAAITDWFLFSSSRTRTMTVGYNLNTCSFAGPSYVFADRVRGASSWEGIAGAEITTAPDGQLASPGLTAGSSARIILTDGPGSRPIDNWGFPVTPVTGQWRAVYTAHGNPTTTFYDIYNQGITITGSPGTGNGPGVTCTQTVTLSDRPAYGVTLAFKVTGNSDGDYITDPQFFDGDVPVDWTSSAHPAIQSRLGDGFTSLRFMTPIATNLTSAVEYDDLPLCFSAQYTPATVPVVISRVDPVDLDLETDADYAVAWLGPVGGNVICAVKMTVTPAEDLSAAAATSTVSGGAIDSITVSDGGSGYTFTPQVIFQDGGGRDARAQAVVSGGVITAIDIKSGGVGYTSAPTVVIASFPLKHGQIFSCSWGDGSTIYPDTQSGSTGKGTYFVNGYSGQASYIISATEFIAPLGSNSPPATPNTGQLVTLIDPISFGPGKTASVFPAAAIQLGWAVQLANDIGIDPWINIPHLFCDDAVYKYAYYIATHLKSGTNGLKWILEYYNEHWNFNFMAFNHMERSASFLNANGGSLTSGNQWYAKRASECYEIAKKAFADAGRSTDDIYFVLGSFYTNPGLTTDMLDYTTVNGSKPNAVAVANYMISKPWNSDFKGAAAGTVTLASGVVTGVTLSSAGSGYGTAPTVTISDSSPGGSGAAATATVGADGTITGITVTPGGSGYTDQASVTIDSPAVAAYNRMDLAGQVEMMMVLILNTGQGDTFKSHGSAISTAYHEGGVDLVQYEGGEQVIGQNSDYDRAVATSYGAARHPLNYWLVLANNQFMQDSGVDHSCFFIYDGTGYPQSGECWNNWDSNDQAAGTGDLSENPNPWNLRTAASQRGGAQQYWASPTPTPTPTPTATIMSFSGQSAAITSVPKIYTVFPDQAWSGTVTPEATGGGMIGPETLTFVASAEAQTFVVIWPVEGTYTISITNDGGLTNSPDSISVVVSAPAHPTPMNNQYYMSVARKRFLGLPLTRNDIAMRSDFKYLTRTKSDKSKPK